MRTKGFTLIEIQIAILVLLVCSLAIMSLFATGFRAGKKAKVLTIASFLAREKMEEALELLSSSPENEKNFPQEGHFPEPFSQYQFSVTLSEDENSPLLRRVKAVVEGPDHTKSAMVTLKSL